MHVYSNQERNMQSFHNAERWFEVSAARHDNGYKKTTWINDLNKEDVELTRLQTNFSTAIYLNGAVVKF